MNASSQRKQSCRYRRKSTQTQVDIALMTSPLQASRQACLSISG